MRLRQQGVGADAASLFSPLSQSTPPLWGGKDNGHRATVFILAVCPLLRLKRFSPYFHPSLRLSIPWGLLLSFEIGRSKCFLVWDSLCVAGSQKEGESSGPLDHLLTVVLDPSYHTVSD